MRNLFIALILLFIGIMGGVYLTSSNFIFPEDKHSETADVVLKRIKKVMKVVTVEGEFSEIYTYDNLDHLLFYPAQKKALVRVNASVLVGYDLEGLKIDVLKDKKQIIVENVPAPKILSLEKSLEYYDITESTFNQFNEKDFTRIDRRTDSSIRKKVSESNLYMMAEEQLESFVNTLRIMLQDAGWTLVWDSDKTDSPFGGALDEG